MEGVNEVILFGSVGSDPEVKQLEGGRTLTKFSLATNRSFKDKKTGEKRTDTMWHNIEAWGPMAETMGKWIKKGQALYIRGEIRYGKYEKDGITRYTTNIMANDFTMIGGKPEGKSNGAESAPAEDSVRDYKTSSASAEPAVASVTGASIMDDEDLPF